MRIRSFGIVSILCAVLFLGSCTNVASFAGNWAGGGTDSEGNEFTFVAEVISLGDDQYRVLVYDSTDSLQEPMHVMDGVLTDGQFPYTADEGLYTGSGTLNGDTFEGWYKGPVDGTFIMQRVNHD